MESFNPSQFLKICSTNSKILHNSHVKTIRDNLCPDIFRKIQKNFKNQSKKLMHAIFATKEGTKQMIWNSTWIFIGTLRS